MCNIAGYTGNRRAAPILIDMLRREQFMDGGLSTGIATIHEGKLYTAKVVGDLDELLRTTDAANFPGTCGIIHSRPAGKRPSLAHPFLDESGDLAVVLNGTSRGTGSPEFYAKSNEIMQKFYDRGCLRTPYKSAKENPKRVLKNGLTYHDTEVYPMLMGDELKKTGVTKENIETAMANAIEALPTDIVVLAVHAALPGVITIGDITRPMCAGAYGEETYLATTALAFPEDVAFNHIVFLPPASVSQATPGKISISGKVLETVRVEQISSRAASAAYVGLEKLLKGQKDNPKSIYEFKYYNDWHELWQEPAVDCVYSDGKFPLKPGAALHYQTLWSFYKEGRLHGTLGEYDGRKIVKFWID